MGPYHGELMEPKSKETVLLKPSNSLTNSPWAYILVGALLGPIFEVIASETLNLVLQSVLESIYYQTPLRLYQAISRFFTLREWPGIILTGALYGSALGFMFHRLKMHHQRLQILNQEFELQVSTLRHHYKNLAIGIKGFSNRVRRKLDGLDKELSLCSQPGCACSHSREGLDALGGNVAILEDTAQRLTEALTHELLFLRALASDSLNPEPQDFYPFLDRAVRDLMGLRFRNKEIRVEINGLPLELCRESLVFPFDPYTMEVILQNILSNAMKYGDWLQIRIADTGAWIRVEVADNGPGVDAAWLKKNLLTGGGRRETDSTHLGLKVTLHLLDKSGGRLLVSSKPGSGATFILEFPKLERGNS